MLMDTFPSTKFISLGEKGYPESVLGILGPRAPKHIHFSGNADLFQQPGVGFCGSRKASEKGLLVARDSSKQLALAGITVVSGYAAGVDMVSHYTALENGGSTIIVLAEGITHFRVKKEISAVWDWNRVLVISQFPLDAGWKAYRAMERNFLIIALSRAMIVIEAGEKGGTLSAGYSSLKANIPLFVAEYADNNQALGNVELLKSGGIALKKSSVHNAANLDAVLHLIDSPRLLPPKQLSLI